MISICSYNLILNLIKIDCIKIYIYYIIILKMATNSLLQIVLNKFLENPLCCIDSLSQLKEVVDLGTYRDDIGTYYAHINWQGCFRLARTELSDYLDQNTDLDNYRKNKIKELRDMICSIYLTNMFYKGMREGMNQGSETLHL